MPHKSDCLDCGMCEYCIDRSIAYAAEQELTAWLTLFGQRVRAKRRGMKMTQAELADRCGVCRNTIVNVERGAFAVSVVVLNEICKATGATPNYFVGGEPDDTPIQEG